jgi:hypothetical protein
MEHPAAAAAGHFLPKIHPKVSQPQKIIKINSMKTLKPYCLIKTKEYQRINQIENGATCTGCPGQDGSGYLTEYEKEKLNYRLKKEKFIGGEFKRFSGVASAMPIRKDGLIRTSSQYLSPLQPHPKDKNIPLYGVWQPT